MGVTGETRWFRALFGGGSVERHRQPRVHCQRRAPPRCPGHGPAVLWEPRIGFWTGTLHRTSFPCFAGIFVLLHAAVFNADPLTPSCLTPLRRFSSHCFAHRIPRLLALHVFCRGCRVKAKILDACQAQRSWSCLICLDSDLRRPVSYCCYLQSVARQEEWNLKRQTPRRPPTSLFVSPFCFF